MCYNGINFPVEVKVTVLATERLMLLFQVSDNIMEKDRLPTERPCPEISREAICCRALLVYESSRGIEAGIYLAGKQKVAL